MFRFPGSPSANLDHTSFIKEKLAEAERLEALHRSENLKGLYEKTAAEQLATNPSPGYQIARLIESLRDRQTGIVQLAWHLQGVMEWLRRRAHGDAVASAIHTDDDVARIVHAAWRRVKSALRSYEEHENEVWNEIEHGASGLLMNEAVEHGRRPHIPDAVDVCMRALMARYDQEAM